MGGEGVMNYVLEKLKGGGEGEMGAEGVMNYVLQKLKEFLLLLENFGSYVLDKLDQVFPPETRSEKLHHWLVVATPFLITGVALLILYLCCRYCCCGGRGMVKMMEVFVLQLLLLRKEEWDGEDDENSRPYFQNLHANPIHHDVSKLNPRSYFQKMMKAPGKNYRMPRHVFESKPRSYFQSLRANSTQQFV